MTVDCLVFDHPEIAYALVIPDDWLAQSCTANFSTGIARELVDKYFDIKKKNKETTELDSTSTSLIKPAFTNAKIDEEEND